MFLIHQNGKPQEVYFTFKTFLVVQSHSVNTSVAIIDGHTFI